ncbi:MAG: hypothetical protein HY748_06280 [Elusimicrobia bacterium]|nr:hypothetical protein [Elusimicrobiota bacterium]
MTAGLILWLAWCPARIEAAPYRPPKGEIDRVQQTLDAIKRHKNKKENQDLVAQKKDFERKLGLRDEDGKWLGMRRPEGYENWSEWQRALYEASDGLVNDYAKKIFDSPWTYTDYARVIKDYEQYQEESTRLHSEAIKVAMEVYHISPPKKSGPVLSGPPCHKLADGTPDPGYVECYIGETAAWDPKYNESLGEGKGRAGETGPDGKVHIGPDAFKYPGMLAYTLSHEKEHFQEHLKKDVDLRNKHAVEVRHRKGHLDSLKSTFDFTDEDVVEFKKKISGEESLAKQWDEKLKAGLDPYKLSDQRAFGPDFDLVSKEGNVRRTLKQIAEGARKLDAQNQRRNQMISLGVYADQVCHGMTHSQGVFDELALYEPAVYDAEMARMERDLASHQGACWYELTMELLRKLKGGERLEAGWVNAGKARYDERKREQAEREAEAALDKLAATYGFVWDGVDRGGWHVFRKADAKPPDVKCHFRLKRLDQAHAALFLVRTCLDRKIAEPSAEALGILSRRIGDPTFRDALAMRYASGDVGWCYADYLLRYYGHLTDAGGINELLALMAEMRRRAEGGSREPRDSARRKDEADRNSRKQEGQDMGIDLTPAKEALERARRRMR